MKLSLMRVLLIALICLSFLSLERCHAEVGDASSYSSKLRVAVLDLIETFGDRYPNGGDYLDRLRRIEGRLAQGKANAKHQLETLRSEALLANPLLTELEAL